MIKVYIGRHVKYPLLQPSLIRIEFSRRIWEKHSNIKFNTNPFSGSRVVPCRQTDRQTDKHYAANTHSSKFCERA